MISRTVSGCLFIPLQVFTSRYRLQLTKSPGSAVETATSQFKLDAHTQFESY